MKKMISKFLLVVLGGLTLQVQAFAQSCYTPQAIEAPEAYSIQFNDAFPLQPVKSNNNWYAQVQAGRAFGCVIFAVEQTEGVLKGTYKAVSASRLNSICEGKQDYVFTQFANEEGRRTFRLQCEYPVFEDNLPQPFAPTFEQAAKINFSNGVDRSVEVVQ